MIIQLQLNYDVVDQLSQSENFSNLNRNARAILFDHDHPCSHSAWLHMYICS